VVSRLRWQVGGATAPRVVCGPCFLARGVTSVRFKGTFSVERSRSRLGSRNTLAKVVQRGWTTAPLCRQRGFALFTGSADAGGSLVQDARRGTQQRGLVVVYSRCNGLAGKTCAAAPKAASVASWETAQDQLSSCPGRCSHRLLRDAGTLVSNFSASTTSCLALERQAPVAMGPSLGLRPVSTTNASSGTARFDPSAVITESAASGRRVTRSAACRR